MRKTRLERELPQISATFDAQGTRVFSKVGIRAGTLWLIAGLQAFVVVHNVTQTKW